MDVWRRFLNAALAFALAAAWAPPAAGGVSAQESGRPEVAPRSAPPRAESDAEPLEARLAVVEKLIEKRRRELGVPGLSLVVVKDDRVVYMKGLGVRDFEKKLPVTPDTLFAIGSSSKAFTAMLVAMAADAGRLSFDDPPRKFLPYFKLQDPEADAKITVRDLLSHSSGLNRTDIAWITGRLTREEVIRVAALAKPTAKLRERFLYQNVMYAAAGEVAARAEGSTWEESIRRRIFGPLGMKASALTAPEMQRAPDHSFGYEYDEATKETRRLPQRDFPQVAAAGAINSNARDMAQWLRLMLGGGAFEGRRLVSEKNFAELFKPHQKIGGPVSYGLGWFLREWRGHKVVEHGGNIDGFNAQVALMPDRRLGFALLTNVTSSDLPASVMEWVWAGVLADDDELRTLRQSLSPDSDKETAGRADLKTPQPAGPPATTPASGASAEYAGPLKEVVGTYDSEKVEGRSMEVTIREGKVFLVVPGQPPYPLSEKSKDVFVTPALSDEYSFNVRRDEKGVVSGIVVKQPAGESPYRRAPEFRPGLTAEELMAKVVNAAGGEAAWRRHRTMTTTLEARLEHQGVTAEGTTYAKAPNMAAQEMTLYALGKKIGSFREFFDGEAGGEEASFMPPRRKTGKALADARVAADFYGLVNWKTLFKTVELKRLAKVGGEEAYVVVMKSEGGNPVTAYFSTKTFLLLRRDSFVSAPSVTEPLTEKFSDYRSVDGVMIPFTQTSAVPSNGETTIRLKEVRFNVDIPDAVFRRGAR